MLKNGQNRSLIGTYNTYGDFMYFLPFQNIHVSFLRTVPPYSHQANVWVQMLKQFKYRQLVFIHSSDTDGRALLGRFQTQTQDLEADDQEVKVQVAINFGVFKNVVWFPDPPVMSLLFMCLAWRSLKNTSVYL